MRNSHPPGTRSEGPTIAPEFTELWGGRPDCRVGETPPIEVRHCCVTV
jgi:hypothetical protein